MPMTPVRTCLLALAAALSAAAAPAPSYHVAGRIAGPDGAGWDYARVDPATHRLYVAHGEAVAAFDLAHGGKGVTLGGGLQRAHAVVPIQHGAMLLVTSGQDSTVRLLDAHSGAQVASLKVDEGPDDAIPDPATGHVLVMNAHAGSVAEVDPSARRVVRTISVKPALEEAAIGRGRTLFINNEDANEIEVVDLARGKAVGAIPLTGCEGPTGLAYDAPSDRLIAACANGQAAIVDASARKLDHLVAIGRGPDGVLLDAKRRLVFIPCGRDGVLDILSIDRAGAISRAGQVTTEPGARTGALDPTTGAIYLPTAAFGPPSAPGKRPPVLPGSFHVLVVRPS